MAAKKSPFDTWFLAQHGPRRKEFLGKGDMDLNQMVVLGVQAQQELIRRQTWDARQTSALYAWNTRGPQKKDARSKGKRPATPWHSPWNS